MRQIIAAQRALQRLRSRRIRCASTQQKLVTKLAYRKVLANMRQILDQMLRLQVLEGAAGLSPGKWSDNPRRGFAKASDYYQGRNLHPAWLAPAKSDLYNILWSIANKVLSSSFVPDTSADDIMQNVLLGLSLDGKKGKRPLYEAGKFLGESKIVGKETPKTVGKGLGGTFVRRKALNEVARLKSQKGRMEEHGGVGQDDPEYGGIGGTSIFNVPDRARVLTDIFFDKRDPLGAKFHKLLWYTAENKMRGKGQQQALLLLNKWEETGSLIRAKQEAAEELGHSSVTTMDRSARILAERTAQMIANDRKLQKQIEMRLQRSGL